MQDFDYETDQKKVSGTFEIPASVAHLAAPAEGETAIVIRVRAENNKPYIAIDSTLSMGDTHEQLMDVIRILEKPEGGE